MSVILETWDGDLGTEDGDEEDFRGGMYGTNDVARKHSDNRAEKWFVLSVVSRGSKV